MLTIWGSKQGCCDGLSRRNFLKIGAFGAGLTLADVLRLRAEAAAPATTSSPKSAIMIYLSGGPAHMDMYDLKPEAPAEFRGEFRPIATNVPGVRICEHFPLQARMWDKLACIRSLVAADEHSDSLVMTGKTERENMTANHPSFGSVLSRLRSASSDLPPFVSLRGMSRGTEPGFLGMAHRPFAPSGPALENLRPLAAVAGGRIHDRRGLLESFDDVRRDLDDKFAGLDTFTSRAFDMIASGGVRNALDLTREPAHIRQKYQGVEQFLTARRLVEAGVGCVTLSFGGWDTHDRNFETLRRQLPQLDKGVSHLISDLHQRGLSDEVVTVMWGEFGRTPRINQNAGRDHWAPVMSALIAGGGLRMGQAIGASTARGEQPQDRRYTVPQVLATLYQTIGIDPAATFLNSSGRPVHIVEDLASVRDEFDPSPWENLMKATLLGSLLGLLVLGGRIAAQDGAARTEAPDAVKLPAPAEVKVLQAYPTDISMVGADESRQLVITAVTADHLQDLTGNVHYEVADPALVRVSSGGRIVPLANGATTITARYGNQAVAIAVKTQSMDESLPINFGNHIVPIFTKLGCNSGGCHGKSGGQNGFALSLLGFVPDFDYQTLVKENRGRRLLPSAPDFSLLLLKATGTMAHAGGKRMEVGSDEYKLIRRWIAGGAPLGSPTDPTVAKITIFPEQRIISRQNRQQFAVLAHYTDGTVIDVTQRAQYESNDPDIAVVDGTGLVRSLDMSGEAAVMARYQAQVAVFRATVPLGMKIPDYDFQPKTIVDRFTRKKWQELGIVPSDLATDEQFLRRVCLDITGTLPTPEKVKAFLADQDPDKRDKVIDALLESPAYSYFFANRWADILRVKRGNQNIPGRAFGTFAFHGWIVDSIARDKPYDQFVREILTAIGDDTKAPPTMWYRDLQKPEQFVDDACQLFLGVRMACAQCHHHPYEKWSQDDYWGLAAFFAQLGRKAVPVPGAMQQGQQGIRQVIFNKGAGTVVNTRTQKPALMKALDGVPVTLGPGEDPRQRLVDWMVAAKNPFFARSVANRYWAHFFGKGIVDALDDMRVTNPPSNPELLDALAKELIDSKFSLKHLIRVITRSRTYQLSAEPNDSNKHDKKAYARFYPRRISAEVLYDAVSQVTGTPAAFPGLPTDKFAPTRAIMLPDEGFQSYFLDVFGRPQRISACECERVSEPNLAQSLHLLNSQEIQGKLTRAGGRAERLAKDDRSDAEKIDELFLWAFARHPTPTQLDLALADVERHAKEKRLAYENIIWALINTKEFVLTR